MNVPLTSVIPVVGLALLLPASTIAVPQRSPVNGAGAISERDLREFLTFIASDALEGRATYSEGLGLAAQYIAQHLKEWRVEPGGDHGTYFQRVTESTVSAKRASTITVTVAGQTRTFRDAEGFLLPANQGGAQTLSFDRVEFVGYGLSIPQAGRDDFAGVDVKGKLVMYTGRTFPDVPREYGRLVNRRDRMVTEQKGAAAVIEAFSFAPDAARPAAQDQFRTAARYDRPIPPVVNASDDFMEFLLRASGGWAALKQKAAAGTAALPRMSIPAGVRIDVAPQYSVVSTQSTRNVIGIVRGTDASLRDTYVGFGAHYDHVGVLAGAPRTTANPRIRKDDRIFNGADDDGSGTVALMSIAKAFALGPKPKRSLMFVWHTGEEGGLRGSRFNAEVIDPQKVAAVLNMDMIGRNFEDKPEHANHLFIVGSDRISTELHNVNEDANAAMAEPLTFDYAMNDPADPESIYTRSDHYSYAAKGIPVIFYFAGLHPDYHQVSDEIDAINWDKLTRIARLVHETGMRVGNMARPPERDNKGPRAGKGFKGMIK